MTSLQPSDSLDIGNVLTHYRDGRWTPVGVMEEVIRRIEAHGDPAVFISLVPRQQILDAAGRAAELLRAGKWLPLLGVPFAIKDNIDLAGSATTAACPEFSYVPAKSSTVVNRLVEAGAIAIGKTNLDQFATGLVGTRSPYGTPRNPFNADYIPGGSSSGSGVAVASGLVSFALGTDTAGSGRVPAAFNNIVGLKPTRGRLSTSGLVPACRSLDCISVFALTCADGSTVLNVAAGFDPDDDFSIPPDHIPTCPQRFPDKFRFGVPRPDQLRFFGNEECARLFRASLSHLRELGGISVEVDYEPFALAGALLYEGAWLAERLASTQAFMEKHPNALLPLTSQIIRTGGRFDAVSAFKGMYALQGLRRQAASEWKKMDFLLLPTTGTIYTLAEIAAEPFKLNSNLGYYTNFVNLMDLTALAIPAGFTKAGPPLGVTLMAPAGFESALLEVGERLHRSTSTQLGATGASFPPVSPFQTLPSGEKMIRLAVVGAHLSGQPLNHQLTSINATLVRACKTAAAYRLYALPGTQPPKPGLIRSDNGCGAAIEIEVWEMNTEAFGGFVAAIPPPLGVGTIDLEDGERVKSFLCESFAIQGAMDISHFGGWLSYLRNNARN